MTSIQKMKSPSSDIIREGSSASKRKNRSQSDNLDGRSTNVPAPYLKLDQRVSANDCQP